MEESFTIPADDSGDSELDPRIQIELEKLNAATDEINKLETELDESNTTFRMLLGEASRRLQAMGKRMGSCVDRARPYYDALDAAAKARTDCQRAAVQFQRASELHAAAKETVSLAEQRFVSKQLEWQFDSAWQEMLNHATIKVMDAENRKAESGREHHKRATMFHAAERKVSQLEDSLKRHITKSRSYFDEKTLCQEQLNTQKKKIENLQQLISRAKCRYSQSLKTLEVISEEIHQMRGEYLPDKDDNYPVGPREPGVGAERAPPSDIEEKPIDLSYNLDQHTSSSRPSSATVSTDNENDDDTGLQELRLRVRELALRPIDSLEGESDEAWASELNETINKLDHLLLMKETTQNKRSRFTTSHSKNSQRSSGHSSPDRTKPPDDTALFADMAQQKNDSGVVDDMEIHELSPSQNLETSTRLTKDNAVSHGGEAQRNMMSLDVVALVRDTANVERESFLKAAIEDRSPTGTYTESVSERNDSPDEILMVECEISNDNVKNPIIKLTNTQSDQ